MAILTYPKYNLGVSNVVVDDNNNRIIEDILLKSFRFLNLFPKNFNHNCHDNILDLGFSSNYEVTVTSSPTRVEQALVLEDDYHPTSE